MVPLDDREAMERASQQAGALIGLVGAKFPYDVRPADLTAGGDAELDNWDIVAPAALFAGATCLQSLFALLKASPSLSMNGSQDAFVLLRRLYEHAVTFAWVAVDPAANIKAWLAYDYEYRLKVSKELKELGKPGLQPEVEAKFKEYISAAGKVLPDLKTRAAQADKHWSSRISVYGQKKPLPARELSFEVMYTSIYRGASMDAHGTAGGLRHLVHGRGGGLFTIGVSKNDAGNRYAYTFAPVVFAAWLLVWEQVLGWPAASDVYRVFEKYPGTKA